MNDSGNFSLRPSTFKFNKPDRVGSNTVFSLQDICKLNVLFNFESFSDHLLSRLPISIRSQIFKTLPIFDRLHYENAQFCKGLDIKDICPPPKQDESVISHDMTRRVLCGNNEQIKEKLLKCLFLSKHDRSVMPGLNEGCGLKLKEASDFIDSLSAAVECDSVAENHFKYIKRFLPCKLFTWSLKSNVSIPQDESSEKEPFCNYFIIPARFMEFLDAKKGEMWEHPSTINIAITDPHKFRSYCNLHTISPNTLSIDAIQLIGSAIWREYNRIRTTPTEKHHTRFGIDLPIVNPISPLLQDILASVEHLSIGTNEEFEPTNDDEDLSIDAPNFILINIVSREKPRLKSIHIHGIAQTVIDAVVTVGAFLCGVDDYPVIGINDRCTEEGFEYSLVPPSKSCSIESLRITAESGDRNYVRQYLLAYNSATVCNVVKSVLRHQKTTLRQLALKGLGFTYEEIDTSTERLELSSISYSDLEIVNCDEYRSLLNTTLVDFVQLPQFESLELGDSPDTECYPLILAFMTTPTSHEQKLVISLRADSKPTISDWCEQYPIPTALPHSNIKFKSLVFNGTERSKLVQYLFGFPDLSLRFLQFSTVNFEGKVPSTGVNIESLVIQIDSKIMDVSKLDVFISKNPVLKHLTISLASYGQYDSSIFSVVNECLLRMVKKRMSLDSITLQEIQLSKHIQRETYGMRECRLKHQHSTQGLGLQPSPGLPLDMQPSSFLGSDEEGYDFTKWMPSQEEVDLGTWFASLPDGSDNIPSEVLDKDVFLFLCLVQKLNATLTMTSRYGYEFQPEYLEFNLIPSLEKSLKKSNVKLRKIIINDDLKKFEESFMRIASTVKTID